MGGDGAQAGQRPSPEQEPKQENDTEKEFYISVFFSLACYEDLVSYNYEKMKDDNKSFEVVKFLHNAPLEEEGHMQGTVDKSFFIECSDLLFDESNKVIDDTEMLDELLGKCINNLILFLSVLSNKHTDSVIHFNIAANTDVSDLAYALQYLIESKGIEKIKDDIFKDIVSSEYKTPFTRFEDRGCKLKVDYLALMGLSMCYHGTP